MTSLRHDLDPFVGRHRRFGALPFSLKGVIA